MNISITGYGHSGGIRGMATSEGYMEYISKGFSLKTLHETDGYVT